MEIFDYDNILLLPRKCRVESRSECDTSLELGGRRFQLPVVPANMKTVRGRADRAVACRRTATSTSCTASTWTTLSSSGA